ncbi:MAG: efflux transporter outer membrane subunit [Thiothrix sp.]|nr:efflux transporter outer membrane subunit [Thiothrix sp.]HPE61308.1 efflux transporter outer membrane subunit [Thiolinea sp.]
MKPAFFQAALLGGILLLVAGCSNLPTQTPAKPSATASENLPAGWTATSDSLTPGDVVKGNWWTAFNDASLNRIITQAVGNNYQIAQSRAQLAQANAQAIIAGASRVPAVSAGLQASRTRQGDGSGDHSTNETYGLNLLNVSWEVDLWGRLRAQSAAANESYLASNEALRAVRQAVAAQTAKTYLALVESKQQLGLSQRTLQVMTETARQVGNRADVGIGSPSDKYLSQSNRDSAKAGLAGHQETLDRVSRQLQLLMSAYPNADVATANALPALPALPKAGVPASLLTRRPDVLAAERRLRAVGFNVIAAKRSLLPHFSLSTGLGTASTELKDLLDGDFSLWSLGGNLLQPVFQGGTLRANVQLNEAQQQEAANAYAQVALTAFSEVETALAARSTINNRQAALCSAANAAKSAEQIAFNRYRQGIEPFLTVLESQQRTLNASSACISAKRAALDNYVDLQLALGGGFETLAASPTTLQARTATRLPVPPNKQAR